MNIILTGATGTLGSKIVFELITLKFEEIKNIYLLVRKKNHVTPKERIENMFLSASTPTFIKQNLSDVLKKIKIISDEFFLKPSTFLDEKKNNYFIHSAGYVNLSIDPSHKTEIFEENFVLTKKIFNTYTDYIDKFIYISTAFSVGDIGGFIENDYLNIETTDYRNYYEESKHAAEKFLIKEAKEKGIAIQILRPSVLGGNFIDTPNFFISKYMVFYLFAKFFYKNNSDDDIRLNANSRTGLNIIPTDYVAKVIVKVFESNIEQLNIVHSKGTNLIRGMSKILEVVDFKNFSFTQEAINNDTKGSELERFYYKTIGIHLTPYLTSKPCEWDTALLESILPIPKYDLENYLVNNVKFAKTKNFRNERW